MIEFTIKDMTCGHCVGRITQAIQSIDRDAKVTTDIATQRVRIDSRHDATVFSRALSDVGYPPLQEK